MTGHRFAWLKERRFGVLLLSLLLLFLLQPILASFQLDRAKFLLTVFITIILFSSVYAVSENKRLFIVTLCLGIPALGSQWFIKLVGPSPSIEVANLLVNTLLFLVIAYTILSYVMKEGAVTGEKIYAAICVYLFIGLVWAFLFNLIHNFRPASFELHDPELSQFVYYSFTTLSTLGYGDITPLTPGAQALAYVEAIIGQIYLTVLVARLVGLHITYQK